jgi:hypothetical protein
VVFEVFDALLVSGGDALEPLDGVEHDFEVSSNLAEAFVVLDLGCGDELHSLGEGFVALSEPVEAFVDGHGRVASPVFILLQ